MRILTPQTRYPPSFTSPQSTTGDTMLRSMWRERVKTLNNAPHTQLFEVSATGTIVGGDIASCKGAEDGYPVVLNGLKPGVWHITLTDNRSESRVVTIRWVSFGPLHFDNLPSTLPNPVLTPLSPLQRLGSFTVEEGIHGLFDREGLVNLIRVERNNRDYVLEAISDYWLWGKNLAVQIGFVVGGVDGPYRIVGRKHNGLIVELSVIPDR
ncbi:hypothetical protein BXZ70DRAFT_946490 [Cristinia sonorae]|uniref:Uncharacterized protein n=1 Tax=Cristinia sonorae TaxID=1940300 RepID=A0A8K0UJT4_9AGAR|nr:hypothetical protein BXZ70DRAFT_946490 [Cristinia sonorae]